MARNALRPMAGRTPAMLMRAFAASHHLLAIWSLGGFYVGGPLAGFDLQCRVGWAGISDPKTQDWA
jgi:hypothetical protein